MNREQVLGLLKEHKPALAQRFGVVELALFGSIARDEASSDSDVDVLVRFDKPPHWRQYFGAQCFLEELLGCPVDMATHQELREEIKPFIEQEAVDV